MAEPVVLDARGGLTRGAIESLRRADRLQVGIKSPRTAVLGLWPPEERASFTALIIPAFWLGPIEQTPRGLLDMLGPTRGGPWGRIAAEVRPGDRLTLIDRDRRGVWLRRDARDGATTVYPLSGAAGHWRPASQSN